MLHKSGATSSHESTAVRGTNPKDIKTYFEQVDTPSTNSPVGVLMVKVLAKNPGMDFERARGEANRLLDVAAKGRVYRKPRVYSPAERAVKAAQFAGFVKVRQVRSQDRQIQLPEVGGEGKLGGAGGYPAQSSTNLLRTTRFVMAGVSTRLLKEP